MACRASLGGSPAGVSSVSPLKAAALAERWSMLRRLVELSVELGSGCGSFALLQVVKAGERELIDYLCSRKASPDAMGEAGSACAVAAAAGQAAILQTLASARADLD